MKAKKPAFTLAEIVLAIIIIGLIFSIVSFSLGELRRNARDTKRLSDIEQIQLALEEYYLDEGTYPDSLNFGESLIGSTTDKIYMAKIPQNPQPRSSDCSETEYYYAKTNSGYELRNCLERKNNDYDAGQNCFGPTGIISCGFVCGTDKIVDVRDGKTYETTKIGEQCWMAENLNYDNGCASIPFVSGTDNGWCGCYDNTSANCLTYGKLYQWSITQNNICPSGWHIPTHDELTTLERAVCSSGTCLTDFPYDTTTVGTRGTNEGSKLKTITGWTSNNGTDDYGFSALPSGLMYTDGSFGSLGSTFAVWSSITSSGASWQRQLYSTSSGSYRSRAFVQCGLSIRCLKD